MTAPTTLQAFLFTDLIGSTELKRVLGDDRGAAAIARHDALFRSCLEEFEGVEQNNPGDGFFATFVLPSSAVRCALAFQQGLRALDPPLEARVGIHVGESSMVPGARGQPAKLLGLAVDVAGRVMSLACAGQILLTRHAFDAARQHVLAADANLAWCAHGPYLLKGIDEPIEMFETGEVGCAPLRAPEDSAKARRSIRPGEEETLGWRPAAGLEVPGRGGWKLVSKLGEGGFGEIWLVRSERTKEQRAFKFCFHADRLRSLKRELTLFRLIKQTLGDRPDITRLYDVQFDESPYFLEMEYTSGGSLDQWFSPEVPLSARLELVAQIADALAAAHSVGVIHKDVKPSNVLIDVTHEDRPSARLTDFGIGRLLDRDVLGAAGVTGEGFDGEPTLFTDLASRTGTRLYMAPELLSGRPATISSDIYATGVMLYQLAVGDLERPIAQGWESDIDDELLREDIAACVAGSPDARLPSADLLAARLRNREQRRRERQDAIDQQRRDARRRRFLRVSLAASAVLLLVAGTSVIGYFRAEEQRRRAEQAETRARERFDDVRGLANAVLFEFDDHLRDLPGALPARRLLVERALGYLDSLPVAESDDDLEFALERARGYLKVAGVQGLPGQPNLGDREGALANLSKALAIVESFDEQRPGTREIELTLAEILEGRGALLTRHNRDNTANRDLDRALEILKALVDRHSEDLHLRAVYGRALSSKGQWVYFATEGASNSFPYFEKAIATLQPLQQAGQLQHRDSLVLAVAHSNFGSALAHMGPEPMQLDRAFEQHALERTILEGLAGDGPEDLHIQLALVRNHMLTGRICYFQKRYPDALEWYGKSQKRVTRLIALYPNDLRTRRFLAQSARRMAQVHNREGDTTAALQQYERGIAALTDLPPGTVLSNEIYRERAVLHESASGALLKLNRAAEAPAELALAVADFEQTFDAGSKDIYRQVFYPLACSRAASSAQRMGDQDAALAYLRRMDAAFAQVEEHSPSNKQICQLAADSRRAFAVLCRERGLDPAIDAKVRRRALQDAITTYRRMLATYEAFPDLATQARRDQGHGGDAAAGDVRAEFGAALRECEQALAKIAD